MISPGGKFSSDFFLDARLIEYFLRNIELSVVFPNKYFDEIRLEFSQIFPGIYIKL